MKMIVASKHFNKRNHDLNGKFIIIELLRNICPTKTDTIKERLKQPDRQTDRQTDRQIDRQTGRQTDRQKDRQIDRQIEIYESIKYLVYGIYFNHNHNCIEIYLRTCIIHLYAYLSICLYLSFYLSISYDIHNKITNLFQNLSVTNLMKKKFLWAVYVRSIFDY